MRNMGSKITRGFIFAALILETGLIHGHDCYRT